MMWRAVPPAVVTAATLLLSSAAWGQTPTAEPTPSPTALPSPAQTSDPAPSAPVDEPVESATSDETRPTRVDVSPRPQRAAGPVAATPTKVTLFADRTVGSVGSKISLRGKASPDGGTRWIKIENAETGRKIRAVRTGNDGRFTGKIRLRESVPVRARWHDVKSKWLHLAAIPRLNLRMGEVRLFARTRVSGHLSKAAAQRWVKLKLRRLDTGKVVDRRAVRTSKSGHFSALFRIKKPGTYRAGAQFDHERWRKVSALSAGSRTPLPSLGPGSAGRYVKLLERRLVQLRHHLRGRDFYYGQDTADAVMAFNKVHGRARVSSIGAATWYALAAARPPKARFTSPRFHIEVNQSKQVLYVVRRGKVRGILHVSTGASGTPTYDGTYQFWGKIAGYSPKRLYYPSYFHGGRAVHGWPQVPPYNASHGCVRVPMWAARWIYGKTEVGDVIKIYH